jgi:hypothetical protein
MDIVTGRSLREVAFRSLGMTELLLSRSRMIHTMAAVPLVLGVWIGKFPVLQKSNRSLAEPYRRRNLRRDAAQRAAQSYGISGIRQRLLSDDKPLDYQCDEILSQKIIVAALPLKTSLLWRRTEEIPKTMSIIVFRQPEKYENTIQLNSTKIQKEIISRTKMPSIMVRRMREMKTRKSKKPKAILIHVSR